MIGKKLRTHVTEWSKCQQCSLGRIAHRHCLYRGEVPCDVLFVGEAPGKTEDLTGKPFIGPAGQLLDEWIENAIKVLGPFPWAVTNTVACRPTNYVAGPNRAPKPEEVSACRDRLLEFVGLCHPKVLVSVGRIAENAMRGFQPPTYQCFYLVHPAAVLRNGGAGSDQDRSARRVLINGLRHYLGVSK